MASVKTRTPTPKHVAFPVFQTPFFILPFCFHGLKTPRLFALWASRLPDVFTHNSSLTTHHSLLYILPIEGEQDLQRID